MRTFEEFITEAIDEMGLSSRVASGQLTPEQEAILKQRQDRRANSSALAIRPSAQPPGKVTTATPPGKVTTATPPGKVTTATPRGKISPTDKAYNKLKANQDAQKRLEKENKPSFGQRLSGKLDDKKDKFKDDASSAIVDAPGNLAKGAGNLVKKIGSQLLKPQAGPKVGVDFGKDLAGPKRLGDETR